jgi:Slp family outer membrane lipoprotein
MVVKYVLNRRRTLAKEDEMVGRPKGFRHPSLLKVGIILFLLVVFNGCSSTREKPDRKEGYEKIPFSEIHRSPERYQGRVVRLGGVIVDVVNKEEGSALEILEKPLNWRGRPKPGDEYGGRFMVVFEKFLDKEIYRPNRPITVVGEVIGKKTALIGEMEYDYPLLSGRQIHLWEEKGSWDRARIHFGIGASGGSGGTGVGGGVGISF